MRFLCFRKEIRAVAWTNDLDERFVCHAMTALSFHDVTGGMRPFFIFLEWAWKPVQDIDIRCFSGNVILSLGGNVILSPSGFVLSGHSRRRNDGETS